MRWIAKGREIGLGFDWWQSQAGNCAARLSLNIFPKGGLANMTDSYTLGIRLQWAIFHDTVLRFARHMDVTGLHRAIEAVRPARVEPGQARGEWAHLLNHPDLDDQRQELLYHLVDLAEERMGSEWPFLNDRRPLVPESTDGLGEVG